MSEALKHRPCAVCYEMYEPRDLKDNTCRICHREARIDRQSAELASLKAEVEKYRTALEAVKDELDSWVYANSRLEEINCVADSIEIIKSALTQAKEAMKG